MLDLARPLLYSKLWLNATSPEEIRIAEASQGFDRWGDPEAPYLTELRRQAHLYKVFAARPEYGSYVKSLQLLLDNRVDGGRSPATHFLAAFSTLRRLEIVGDAMSRPYKNTFLSIVDNCPRSITRLNLATSDLPVKLIYELLEKVPFLANLCVDVEEEDPDSSRPALPTTPLVLRHLRTLQLRKSTQISSFFATIVQASPVLATLDVDYTTVQTLDPACFTRILHLTIMDVFEETWPRRYPSRSPVDYSDNFATIIQACTSLESFEIDTFLSTVGAERVAGLEVLHLLPPTLRDLTLCDIRFTTSYLFDFLSSFRSNTTPLNLKLTHLDEFLLEDGEPVSDPVAAEQVEELCEKRKISLKWL
ncbi:hypothetical protein JCM16303_007185 [Sporobolomyces ruberrimus]